MNTERIVHLLRTNPDAEVETLIAEDASAMMERIVTAASPTTQRRHMIEYARQVHSSSAEIVTREHRLRISAALDAAEARAARDAANEQIVRMLAEIRTHARDREWGALSEEEQAGILADPVAELRDVLGYDPR